MAYRQILISSFLSAVVASLITFHASKNPSYAGTEIRIPKAGIAVTCPPGLGVIMEDAQVRCAHGSVPRLTVTWHATTAASAEQIVQEENTHGLSPDAVTILERRDVGGAEALVTTTHGTGGRDLLVVRHGRYYILHSDVSDTLTERFFSSLAFID